MLAHLIHGSIGLTSLALAFFAAFQADKGKEIFLLTASGWLIAFLFAVYALFVEKRANNSVSSLSENLESRDNQIETLNAKVSKLQDDIDVCNSDRSTVIAALGAVTRNDTANAQGHAQAKGSDND